MAVLTSGELAIVRAASHASSCDAAPVTLTVTSLVAPSPPRTISRARCSDTARRPASNAGSSSRVMSTPDVPDAISITQSFVEHSPSTVIALNVSSATRRSARCSTSGATRASVVRKPSIVAMRGSIMPEPFAMPPTLNEPAAAYEHGLRFRERIGRHDGAHRGVVAARRSVLARRRRDAVLHLDDVERHADHAG